MAKKHPFMKILLLVFTFAILMYLITKDYTYSKDDFIKAKNVTITSKPSLKGAKCTFITKESIFIIIKRKEKPTANGKISDSVRVTALKYNANTILIKDYKVVPNSNLPRLLRQMVLKVEIYNCIKTPKAVTGTLFYRGKDI